jgi:hypothetical protein
MNLRAFIYELIDPRNGLPFYVGKTVNPRVRLKGHKFASSKFHNSILHRLIGDLKREGRYPELRIIEECATSQWQERERHWISEYQSRGINILNISVGGNGCSEWHGVTHSDATKVILREKNREQFSDSEKRKRHSNGVKQWFASLSPEQQDRLRDIGRKELAKHRDPERTSRTAKRHWNSMTAEERAEFISWRAEKLRESNLLPEIKKVRSEAAKKRWGNPETRKKNLDSLKATWNDPEKRAARLEKIRMKWVAKKVYQ